MVPWKYVVLQLETPRKCVVNEVAQWMNHSQLFNPSPAQGPELSPVQNTTRCLLGCTPTTKKLDNIVESVEAELMINVSVRTSTDALLRAVLSAPEAVLTEKQVGAAVLGRTSVTHVSMGR